MLCVACVYIEGSQTVVSVVIVLNSPADWETGRHRRCTLSQAAPGVGAGPPFCSASAGTLNHAFLRPRTASDCPIGNHSRRVWPAPRSPTLPAGGCVVVLAVVMLSVFGVPRSRIPRRVRRPHPRAMSRIPPGFPRSPTGHSSQDPVESSCIGDSVRATLVGPGTLGELGPAGARREMLSALCARMETAIVRKRNKSVHC